MAASVRFRDGHVEPTELRPAHGRDAELAAFGAWLSTTSPGALLHLRGPGGIGKTTLLHAMRGAVERAGQRAVLLDLAEVPAQPPAAEVALHSASRQLGVSGGVLLLDSFDAHARLEPWYRAQLHASRPLGVRWVVAGRRALQRAWLHGVESAPELTVQTLAPLPSEASRELLKSVPEPLLGHLTELCLGHPGALSEAVRLTRIGVSQPTQIVDRVYAAVAELSDTPPSQAHLEALRIASLLPAVDLRLVAAALDTPEAARLFDWLAGQAAMHAADGRLALDELFAQALRRDYQLSQPEAYAQRVLQLGRLLAERLERANRPEARASAVDGLLRLGQESSDLPLQALSLEAQSVEAAQQIVAREQPDALQWVGFDGRAQCQLVRGPRGELLGCVLLTDPRVRTTRLQTQNRAIRGFLSVRAVSAAERVLLLEPIVFGVGAARPGTARAVFNVVARLLHSDRRLSVGIVACTPEDQALPAFGIQLGMLAPLPGSPPPSVENSASLWFCDHAKRGAAACLYARLVERHAPRSQTVVA